MQRRLIRALVPVYLVLIVGLPFAAALYPAMRAGSAPARLALLGLAPAVYALGYLLVAGALARLTIWAIVPGRFPRDLGHRVYGPRRLYGLCWTAIYYCGPLYHAVLAIPTLKRLVLRTFGYQGALDFIVYPDTWIRDLPLLHVESGAYLSNKATIGTNICLRNGDIVVGHIRVRGGALVGHLAMLGPGCDVGEGAEIGVGAALGMNVILGRGTKIGSCSRVNHGAVIGAGCDVGAVSYVGSKAVIADGVLIPPGSVIPARAVVQSAEDVRQLKLVKQRSVARALGEAEVRELRQRMKQLSLADAPEPEQEQQPSPPPAEEEGERPPVVAPPSLSIVPPLPGDPARKP